MSRLEEIFKTLIDGHDPECTLDTRQCLELFDEGLLLAMQYENLARGRDSELETAEKEADRLKIKISQYEETMAKFPLSKQQELELKILELQTKLQQRAGECVEACIDSYIQGYEDAAQVLVRTSKTHNKELMMKRLNDKIMERRK